jgi:hypothetical protein
MTVGSRQRDVEIAIEFSELRDDVRHDHADHDDRQKNQRTPDRSASSETAFLTDMMVFS